MHLPRRLKLQALTEDSLHFVEKFNGSMEEHPLHVYLTALPAISTSTLLHQIFHDRDVG